MMHIKTFEKFEPEIKLIFETVGEKPFYTCEIPFKPKPAGTKFRRMYNAGVIQPVTSKTVEARAKWILTSSALERLGQPIHKVRFVDIKTTHDDMEKICKQIYKCVGGSVFLHKDVSHIIGSKMTLPTMMRWGLAEKRGRVGSNHSWALSSSYLTRIRREAISIGGEDGTHSN